jgi:L-amino acid N-acyltransferase YncA
MKKQTTIRLITPADAEEALAVYAPYVLNTAISFEYEVPSVEDFTDKIKKISSQYPWLVCEYDRSIIGYAYGSMHRDRTAYQWSPESTIYMSEAFHRRGIARILYTSLLSLLRLQGYYSVYAGVLSSNTKSVSFHKATGFEEIGIYKNIGYKLGQWHSNLWFQLFLQEHIVNPPLPKSINEIKHTEDYNTIMQEANRQLEMISQSAYL